MIDVGAALNQVITRIISIQFHEIVSKKHVKMLNFYYFYKE